MAEVTSCRACAAPLVVVLDLGPMPLANRLLDESQLELPEPRYPLAVALCQSCGLAQLTCTVPPDELFTDYPYFSSFSDTMSAHAAALVERLIGERRLDGGSFVVEIASNDGYLLRNYVRAGIPVLGIEPARNIAEAAQARHRVPTLTEFFGRELGARLGAERRADVVHAHNVLAHVPDIDGFFAGLSSLLAPAGVAVLEFPWAGDLLEHSEFDTIYHEHVFYLALAPLQRLAARHGLAVVDVERVPIHGGSLRVFCGRGAPSARVEALLADELARGVGAVTRWRALATRTRELCEQIRALVSQRRAAGRRIVAYGASAKGSTLLCATGLGSRELDYVVDRSTAKQGKRTPGTHLPIHAPEKLLTDMPDDVLLLTWNFADEILAQQAEYCRRGGTFLVPIPEPRVVGP